MSPTPKQMGQRLQRLRKERDMTRAQLAELAGVSRQYVRQLEAGLSDPTVGTLQKLAKALGVPLTDLLG
jgi:transcriptional regulator with XRE-family HTH domain